MKYAIKPAPMIRPRIDWVGLMCALRAAELIRTFGEDKAPLAGTFGHAKQDGEGGQWDVPEGDEE